MEPSAAPAPRPRVSIETLGCKLNLADSEALGLEFLDAGFELAPPGWPADVYVLNTCTVTHVADAKARGRLRAVRRKQPGALIVATGCYPSRDATELHAMPEVDLVAPNAAKPELVAMVQQAGVTATTADDLPPRAAFPTNHTRAFVKIQEGCNDHCAYCIIPRTRGASRSFPTDALVAQVQARAQAGHAEVVLTGTQLGDFGIALPGSRRRDADPRDQRSEGDPLAALLHRLLEETSIPRIRLSSLQPQDLTPRLLGVWAANPRVCRHLHLPLQSGADGVLRAMRRRYDAAGYLAAVTAARVACPDITITADLITCFPGETAADFAASLAVCEAAALADVHVFPYSPRPHTPAERLAGDPALAVPEAAKRERMDQALAMATRLRQAHLARFVGDERLVLWEEQRVDADGAERWYGFTDNYLRVGSRDGGPRGGITPTRLVILEGDHFLADTPTP